jgi:hypothetical protein
VKSSNPTRRAALGTAAAQHVFDFKNQKDADLKQIPTSATFRQFDLRVRNFLDCIKSRQCPIADVDGVPSCEPVHAAGPVKEEIAGDREAAAMLERPYRKPWDGVLRGLLL